MNVHPIHERAAVLVCVAEPLLQAGVRASLQGSSDIEMVDADAMSVCRNIDVVVADSATADGLVDAGRHFELGRSLQFARILVITSQAREHAVRDALEQGVHGFVLTSSPVEDLLAGIRSLCRGSTYLCPPLAARVSQMCERDMLTSREDEVLRLLARGQCNKSIARDLDIAVGTVKVHVKSILAKLDAKCRTEAASIAAQRGLVDVPALTSRTVSPLPFPAHWLEPTRAQASFA